MLPDVPRVPPAATSLLSAVGLALVVLVVVAWSVLGPNRVLCIGTDGHVAIEFAHSPCCGDEPASDHAPGAADAPRDCGTCVDLSLCGDAVARAGGPKTRVPAPETQPVAATPCAFAPSFGLRVEQAATCAGRPPDPPPRALRRLRTVPLRC
jgi:hypothetical protein